jgi:ribonuclease HII
MHRALDQLKVRPEAIIVDGNKFKPYREPIGKNAKLSSFERKEGEPLPHTTIVKGDGKYLAIAAASILAKTYRDDYMNEIDTEYPAYQWKKNKGYPTKAHYAAIREVGPSPYHRLTFKGVVDTQLEIDFDN